MIVSASKQSIDLLKREGQPSALLFSGLADAKFDTREQGSRRINGRLGMFGDVWGPARAWDTYKPPYAPPIQMGRFGEGMDRRLGYGKLIPRVGYGAAGTGTASFNIPATMAKISAASLNALIGAVNDMEDKIRGASGKGPIARTLAYFNDEITLPLQREFPNLKSNASPVTVIAKTFSGFGFGFGSLPTVGGTSGIVLVSIPILQGVLQSYGIVAQALDGLGTPAKGIKLTVADQQAVIQTMAAPIAIRELGEVATPGGAGGAGKGLDDSTMALTPFAAGGIPWKKIGLGLAVLAVGFIGWKMLSGKKVTRASVNPFRKARRSRRRAA
jgi:hypothetical protein